MADASQLVITAACLNPPSCVSPRALPSFPTQPRPPAPPPPIPRPLPAIGPPRLPHHHGPEQLARCVRSRRAAAEQSALTDTAPYLPRRRWLLNTRIAAHLSLFRPQFSVLHPPPLRPPRCWLVSSARSCIAPPLQAEPRSVVDIKYPQPPTLVLPLPRPSRTHEHPPLVRAFRAFLVACTAFVLDIGFSRLATSPFADARACRCSQYR